MMGESITDGTFDVFLNKNTKNEEIELNSEDVSLSRDDAFGHIITITV